MRLTETERNNAVNNNNSEANYESDNTVNNTINNNVRGLYISADLLEADLLEADLLEAARNAPVIRVGWNDAPAMSMSLFRYLF